MSASPYQLPVTCFRPLFSWNLPWASTVQIQNLMMSGLSPRRSNSLAREIRPPFFGPLSWQVQRQSGPQAIAAAQTPSVVEASFAVLLPSLVWQKLEFSCESFATDRPVAVKNPDTDEIECECEPEDIIENKRDDKDDQQQCARFGGSTVKLLGSAALAATEAEGQCKFSKTAKSTCQTTVPAARLIHLSYSTCGARWCKMVLEHVRVFFFWGGASFQT